jgi:hypothetical protein
MIVCDSSSLISLSTTGLLGCLIALKKDIGKIYITPEVLRECIERPIQIPAYALSAVRLKRALNEKILHILSPSKEKTYEILTYFNSVLIERKGKKPIHLIHAGEAEIIAAAVENEIDYLLIDERTTRAVVEDIEGLREHLSEELGVPLEINGHAYEKIAEISNGMNFIRSTEIIALSYEKSYFKKFKDLEKEAFKAALYATKFAGCAIGFDEIDEILSEEGIR